MPPIFPCRAFCWAALILIYTLSAAGCGGLPPMPPAKTQTPVIPPPTMPSLAVTGTPSQEAIPTELPGTETPGLAASPSQTTETRSGETQTPSLEPGSTHPAATPTFEATLTQIPLTEPQTPESTIRVPAQSEWVDYGTILEAGAEGEWDLFLWGGFAFSVIKKEGIYYLYYQGSSDYRTEFDETVLWRAIGVATSQDGIHFTKYEGNPILTWFPTQSGEEGAVSSGVTLGEQGETFLFYGANSQETPITVNANVRAAVSGNGFDFTDLGVVLDRTDGSVWGSGDELFAVDAIYHSGQWIVYYIPNGSPESGNLGVAYGDQYNALSQTAMVTSGGKSISVWGTAGHVRLDQDTYALVLNNVRERWTEVRLVSPLTPYTISEPVATYQFEEVQQAALLLDEQQEIWFMYYRTPANSYGVKLAPAGDLALPAP